MSLINEALKKAQSQRTNPPVSTTPPPGSPPPPSTANSAAPQPSPFGKIGMLIAVCAVIVALSVLATVFLLRRPSTAAPTATDAQRIASADTPTAARPVTTAPTSTVAPVGPPVSSSVTAAVNSAATSPQPVTKTVSTGSSAAAVETSAATPIVAPVANPTSLPEPTPVKQTTRVQTLVDKFRITGIRLSDTDSKVILNEHLFRVDDPVESSLGLKLTKIEEHRLTFVDADGNTYVKRF